MTGSKLTMIVRRENLPIFRLITVIAFITTLVTHLATFVGMDARETIPLLDVTLLGGIFALYFVFFTLIKVQRSENTPAETVLSLIPRWANCIVGATLAYAFFNFAVYLFTSEGTQASIDGIYYLISNDKRTMREISPQEYRILSTYTLRRHTSGLLPFYAWLTTGYVFCLR